MHEELVLGTTNAGKVQELAALLEPHGIRVVSLRECPGAVSVEETGTTFAANADLKASQQASALSRWVLAEDSGLCVDALDGAPGIHSARFSAGGDEANNSLLLERLAAVPATARGAHYACHAALADPRGAIVARSQGSCHGTIATAPGGSGGFGYDPLFIPDGYAASFAELGAEIKNRLSHRARALERLQAWFKHAGQS